MASTATGDPTKATTNPPASGARSPRAAGPGPTDVEVSILRALASEFPEESARAFAVQAGRQADTVAYTASHRSTIDPTTIEATRRAIEAWLPTAARRDYLAKLAAGEDPGPFARPECDRGTIATEVLKGILGRGPEAFPGLMRAIESRRLAMAEERSRLAGPEAGPFSITEESRAWLRGPTGDPVAFVEHHLKRWLRASELSARVSALEGAQGRLAEAFKRRVAAAVEASGGVPTLVSDVREAAALADAGIAEGREAMIGGLRGEEAEIDAKLAKLGVDPGHPPENPGRSAGGLLRERAELEGRIEALRKGATRAEAEGAAAIVAAAVAGEPSAWSDIATRARALPSAFPEGFVDAWAAIPLEALLEAGAAHFVDPFEAD